MRKKRPSVGSFNMQSYPNKSAGSVFIKSGVANQSPVNTLAPVISGTTTLGSILSCTTGTWTGIPASFTYTYQWKRGGVNIGGATNSTYTTVVADSGASITCTVTASNGVSPDGTATSNALVMGDYTPVNTVLPVISGVAIVSQVLSTTNGTWTNSPITYTYQWRRDGVDIGSATASSYTLVAADAGKTITCRVTASNGLSASATSAGTVIYNSPVDESLSTATSFGYYSVTRLLKGSFYGNAIIRVRRSGDSSEAEFGVTTFGELDTASLTAFCIAGGGGKNGFVVAIYDQNGSGRKFTQATSSFQPQIVNNGLMITWANKFTASFTSGSQRMINTAFTSIPQPYTTVGVGEVTSDSKFFLDGATSNSNSLFQTGGNMRLANNNSGPVITATNALANKFTVWAISNTPNSKLSINAGSETTGNTNTDAITNVSLGGVSGGLYIIGNYSESYHIEGNQASAKTTLLANIRNYYGHY